MTQVLTDMEISGLIRDNRPTLSPLYADLDFARAVEAAVLAKVPDYLRKRGEYREGGFTAPVRDALRAVADALDGHSASELCKRVTEEIFRPRNERTVTEREARKRVLMGQREGWDACIRELNAHCTSGPDQKWWNRADFQRGRDIRYPLSTKRVPRTVKLSDGRRVSSDDDGWAYSPYSHAKTPADARLLADLVERPYDEVLDDEVTP